MWTKKTPTKPGYYLWRTKLTSGPVTSEIFPLGEGGPLFIDTDDTREELSAFVNELKEDNLEWCRLIPADKLQKCWNEAWMKGAAEISSESVKRDLRQQDWDNSEAKKRMEDGQ